MKKLFLQSTLILCILASPIVYASTKLKTIIINDVDWPPYFFIENSSKFLGLGKTLINLCLLENNYKPEYVKLPIKRTHVYMKNGDIDVTVYSYKVARKEFLHYATEPLFNTEYGFMVRANSRYEIRQLEDINPLRVGHLAGLTYTPELLKIIERKIEKQEAVVANSMHSVFSQLLATNPRIDITANTKSTFYWQASILNVRDKIKVLDYTIKSKKYFITVSKKSTNIPEPREFLNLMDECVSQSKKSGRYEKLLNEYKYSETK